MNKLGKLFLTLTAAMLIGGCSVLQQKDSNIDEMDLENFLITVNDLPDQSWTTKGPSNVVLDRERTADYLFISYFSDRSQKNICFGQDVYRYRSVRGSKRDFNYASTYFKKPYVPEEWTFQSEYANESYFGCDDYLCYWIARYDRIVIDARSWRTSDCMDLADLQEVIRTIDQRASELIYDE